MKELEHVLAVERQRFFHDAVENNSKAPDVGQVARVSWYFALFVLAQALRSHELVRSLGSFNPIISGLKLLRAAEVAKFDLAVLVDENVVWFEVSVHDEVGMQVS